MRQSVYKITNLVTGQYYIGSTKDATTRGILHTKSSRQQSCHGKMLTKR